MTNRPILDRNGTACTGAAAVPDGRTDDAGSLGNAGGRESAAVPTDELPVGREWCSKSDITAPRLTLALASTPSTDPTVQNVAIGSAAISNRALPQTK